MNYKYNIVDSNQKFLYEHDLYNWKINEKTTVNGITFSY